MRRAPAVLAAALLLAGCVRQSTAPGPGASAHNVWTRPGYLRIGVLRDLDTLDPLLSTQAAVTDVAQLVFDGLIRYDADGNAVPDAALAVPTRANGGISPDGRTIVYHLRGGVRFSDGVPLTARDVAFTWRAVLDPRNSVPNHFPYDLAERVSAPDARTVVVRLRRPNAAFVAYFMRCGTQGAILPAHLLARKPDLNHDSFGRAPVGSGPFTVVRAQPGALIEFAPNPHWWGPKPKLRSITYRIIPNENSLLVALRTHDIDFYYAAPEQQYTQLRAIPGIRVSTRPYQSYEELVFNTRRPPFDDVRVRRAALQAIDWVALQRNVYLAVDLPGATDVFPRSWAADPSVRAFAHDPAAAQSLLDAAGWRLGPDGLRTRRGRRLNVVLRTVAGVIPRQNAEVQMQSALRAAGFDVQILNAPANLLFAPLAAGGLLAKGEFDAAIYGWTQAPDPADSEQTIGPDRIPPYGANFSGLRDPRIGALLAAGDASYDRAKRRPAYVALQRREHELVPFQTLVWRANIDAVNSDLAGFRPAVAVSDFWNPWEWAI